MPVGGIIAWPRDSDPSTSSNIWLECNGQSFDTDRFPKLYKVLGSNKTPNFQGMFLRGAGSQSFSQYNGVLNGTSSTTYSSGTIGQIQGDGFRPLSGYNGFNLNYDIWTPSGISGYTYNSKNDIGASYAYVDQNHPVSIPRLASTWTSPGRDYSFNAASAQSGWAEALKKYRYSITGDSESGFSLTETVEYPSLNADFRIAAIGFDAARMLPISNEIRPVNVAVKYYIRAK